MAPPLSSNSLAPPAWEAHLAHRNGEPAFSPKTRGQHWPTPRCVTNHLLLARGNMRQPHDDCRFTRIHCGPPETGVLLVSDSNLQLDGHIEKANIGRRQQHYRGLHHAGSSPPQNDYGFGQISSSGAERHTRPASRVSRWTSRVDHVIHSRSHPGACSLKIDCMFDATRLVL